MTGFLQIIAGKQIKTNFEKVNERKIRSITYTNATTEKCSRCVLDCSILFYTILCCFIFWELTFVKRQISVEFGSHFPSFKHGK